MTDDPKMNNEKKKGDKPTLTLLKSVVGINKNTLTQEEIDSRIVVYVYDSFDILTAYKTPGKYVRRILLPRQTPEGVIPMPVLIPLEPFDMVEGSASEPSNYIMRYEIINAELVAQLCTPPKKVSANKLITPATTADLSLIDSSTEKSPWK